MAESATHITAKRKNWDHLASTKPVGLYGELPVPPSRLPTDPPEPMRRTQLVRHGTD